MTDLTRRKLMLATGVVAATGTSTWSPLAQAQNQWPASTRVVVPFPAGGGVDIVIRKINESLSKVLGTNMVVDNRPGAQGVIAVNNIKQAAPDGSTLLYVSSGFLTLQALGGNIDLFKDMTMVTKTTSSPHALVVSAKSPFRNFRELVAAAQAKPGKLTYASGGIGTSVHLMFETLKASIPGGFDVLHVPFKASGAAPMAIMAGDVDFTFLLGAVAAPFIAKEGGLRAIGQTGTKRMSMLANIPTIAEQGVPGYSNAPWGGIALPPGASPELVARLFRALKTTYELPEILQFTDSTGASIGLNSSPAEMVAEVRAELPAMLALIKKLGLKLES